MKITHKIWLLGLTLLSAVVMHAQQYEVKLGNRLKMSVEVCSEQIYRVKITPNDTFPESLMERYGLLKTDWERPQSAIKENGQTAVITTAEHTLTVNKANGTINVKDANGNEIIRPVTFLTAKNPKVRVMGDSLNARFAWAQKKSAILAHPNSKEYIDAALDAGNPANNSMLGFTLNDTERIYGGGSCSREHIQHRGEILRMWTTAIKAQLNIPFLYSTEGWGVLNNTTLRHYFDVGVTDNDKMWMYNTTNNVDFYLLLGNSMLNAIDLYTQVTGRPMMLPDWAYGVSFSGIEIENIIDALNDAVKFRDEKIPMDMIWIEPQWMGKRYDESTKKDWNYSVMPGVPKWGMDSHSECNNLLVGRMHGLGFKVALWLSEDYDQSLPEEDALAEAAGKPTSGQEHWMDHLMKFVDQGVDGYKHDPGGTLSEHPNREYYNGLTDKEMHNINQVLMPKQYYQTYTKHTNRRPFHHYCAGWAGIQHWSASTSGDVGGGVVAMYDQLNLGMSGYVNTSFDVLSFDYCTEMQAMHFGMFIPWVQINGWFHMLQPWYYSPKEKEAYIYYLRLRHDLFPYIYSAALNGSQTGEPILRPMPMVFTDDRNVDDMTTQYMFGNDLLVGMITDSIYLPKGKWMNYWDGKVYDGQEKIEQIALPENRYGHLFIREGAIIPYQPTMQYIGEIPLDTLTLRVFPKDERTYTMYEDDGVSLKYRDGEIAATRMECKHGTNGTEFIVNPVEGHYDGMYAARTYKMEFLNVNKPASITVDGLSVTDWNYEDGTLRFAACQPDTKRSMTISIKY